MRILLLLLAGLLLAGGGFGAGWYMFAGPGHGGAGAEQGEGQGRGEHAPAAAPKRDPAAPAVFVNIGPLTIPVLGQNRIDQFVTVLVALEVDDAATGERLRALSPKLTDAYLTTLYGEIAGGGLFRNGLLDLGGAKTRLMASTRAVLGDGIVHDVLIQVVTQRPM
jgi:flagellar FliL protein